jgi:DNA invertase Pin-like site-specific DNA recombinase
MPTRRQRGDTLARYQNPPTPRELGAPALTGRVYGYCRISTVQQVEDGESLGVQERTIADYCQMHGLTLDRVFVERGISPSIPLGERPEGAKLLAALKPGDTVTAPRLDWLFRSAVDALQVTTKMRADGIPLHLLDLDGNVSTGGLAKTFFIITSAFAEAERDHVRERISGRERYQPEGRRYLGGKLPWGYRLGDTGELVPIPEQQAALRRMRELRDQGLSLRAIADQMKTAGFSISHAGVKNALAAAAMRSST